MYPTQAIAAVIEKWRGRIDAPMAAIYKKVTRHARGISREKRVLNVC